MELSFSFGSGEQAQPIRAMPLRLVVVGDFSPSVSTPGCIGLRQAGDLEQACSQWQPKVELRVPDILGGSAELKTLALVFASPKDFNAERLVASQHWLAGAAELLVELKDARKRGARALGQLAGKAAAYPALARAIAACVGVTEGDPVSGDERTVAGHERAGAAEAGAATALSTATGAESLLAAVDLPGPGPAPSARSKLGGVISSIAKSEKKKRGGERSALDRAVAAAEALLSTQVDAILHHPDFQRVEAMWRGLRLLVERSDLRSGLRIDVVSATAAELDRWLGEGELLRLVTSETLPPALILAPYLFASETALGPLAALAEFGEGLQVPVVTSVALGFLEQESESGEWSPPEPKAERSTPANSWSAFREEPSTRWLGVVFNRFLLRDEQACERYGYREAPRADLDRLWGDPCWAIGALVARSGVRYGWATQITGPHDGRLTDLSVRAQRRASGREISYPLEHRLMSSTAEALSDSGLIVSVAADNADSLQLATAPMVYSAEVQKGYPLAYQLLVGRIVAVLRLLRGALAELPPAQLREAVEGVLRELVADTGAGAFVEVSLGEMASARRVSISLRTGRAVLRGAGVELDFVL